MLFYKLNPPQSLPEATMINPTTTITPIITPTLSAIISNDTFKYIDYWLGDFKKHSFQLLFRASVDSFSATKFHEKCDNKGPTITIIQTTDGDVFGGYNSQSWESDTYGNYYGDAKCFIFTLVN